MKKRVVYHSGRRHSIKSRMIVMNLWKDRRMNRKSQFKKLLVCHLGYRGFVAVVVIRSVPVGRKLKIWVFLKAGLIAILSLWQIRSFLMSTRWSIFSRLEAFRQIVHFCLFRQQFFGSTRGAEISHGWVGFWKNCVGAGGMAANEWFIQMYY